jgi:hypothetical protein
MLELILADNYAKKVFIFLIPFLLIEGGGGGGGAFRGLMPRKIISMTILAETQKHLVLG